MAGFYTDGRESDDVNAGLILEVPTSLDGKDITNQVVERDMNRSSSVSYL